MYLVAPAENKCVAGKICMEYIGVHSEGGIMLNDPIVIDRYHCETAEAVVVSYPNARITRLYLQPLCSMYALLTSSSTLEIE